MLCFRLKVKEAYSERGMIQNSAPFKWPDCTAHVNTHYVTHFTITKSPINTRTGRCAKGFSKTKSKEGFASDLIEI